ncbi:MAG: succinate-semialdehyde dehydrogenase / glutarate-semialdehyde dehydrogenase [Chloroflexota bacterium]|nr:succinate-semialdehyde dehydrogenase / glutarate-semialdehyde dehydrogenase [Chloroflexota bacterium]
MVSPVIQAINPATEEVIGEYALFGADQVDEALDAATAAAAEARTHPPQERVTLLQNLARGLRAGRDDLARLITSEMGKPITEAEAEVEKCAACCDYYAANGPAHLADEDVKVDAPERGFVAYEPLGVVLAVMPWNFPFWQVFRFAAPALLAGNAAVLKHASNVPGCALAIQRLVEAAGGDPGLFRTLLIPGSAVRGLIADSRIAAVTLTGSTEVGRDVAAAAGAVIKKQVLELGGSDPFVVLDDADLDATAVAAARARNQNAGQSCIAAKRFIVAASIAEAFAERLAAAVADLAMGDPLERATRLGPLARGDLRESLSEQVGRSVSLGARVLTGGRTPDRRGYFFEGTVVTEVTPEMAVFSEETFGPVAAVIAASSDTEAVELANRTEFGLGASIWTSDSERGLALARRIDAGSVFVNSQVASDARFPFGGVKLSGYGRELGAVGVREFTNLKTIRTWPGSRPGA